MKRFLIAAAVLASAVPTVAMAQHYGGSYGGRASYGHQDRSYGGYGGYGYQQGRSRHGDDYRRDYRYNDRHDRAERRDDRRHERRERHRGYGY